MSFSASSAAVAFDKAWDWFDRRLWLEAKAAYGFAFGLSRSWTSEWRVAIGALLLSEVKRLCSVLLMERAFSPLCLLGLVIQGVLPCEAKTASQGPGCPGLV